MTKSGSANRWLGLLSTCALMNVGCLNPSFLALVDPTFIPVPQPAPGFVIIEFENDTNVTARLRVLVQTLDGIQEINFGEKFDDPITSGVSPSLVEIRGMECEVTFVSSFELQVLIDKDVIVLERRATNVGNTVGTTLEQIDTIPRGFIPAQLTRGFPSVEPRCGSVVRFRLTGTLPPPGRQFAVETGTGTFELKPAFVINGDPPFPRTDNFILTAIIE